MSASSGSFTSRFEAYRPFVNRLLFVVALLGVLTTVHLNIQQGRGFDRGCLGFSAPETVEATFDCEAVTSSAAGQVGGVSNAILGFIFYVVVAGISMGVAATAGAKRKRLQQLRFVLISGGFLYSLYLSYVQYFVVEELCMLCLISAALVSLLFLTQIVGLFSGAARTPSTMQSTNMVRDLRLFGALAVFVLVLAGADVVYFNSLDDPRAVDFEQTFVDDQPTATQPIAQMGESSSEAVTPPAETSERASAPTQLPSECVYDPDKDPVDDYMSLISLTDPTKGNMSAEVVVMEYFDPLCPHCRSMHPIMQEVAATYGSKARFVYKPVALLGQRSVAPVAALHAAAQNGKFFEMLEYVFANQKPSGYSLAELRSYAQQVSMNPDVMETRLRGGIYNPTMKRHREEFVDNGFSGVPTVMINGRVVAPSARSVECLGKMIEEAAS